MSGDPAPVPASADAFLGGRLTAVQPRAGHHRAGLDAVLLAAAVSANFRGTLLDLGAGTGVAGMAVATRCPAAGVVLVERDTEACAFAADALLRPENRQFAPRVRVVSADIADRAECEAEGVAEGSADAVIMNPPFHELKNGTTPPSAAKAAAYVLEAGLGPWLTAAVALLKPRGALAVIFRADRLDALLAACTGCFGALHVLPVAPHAGAEASRVLLGGIKGRRTPLRLLPPFVLHAADGTYLPQAEAVLRHGAGLADVHPAWTGIG